MDILQEILKWTGELQPWQSDAVGRLLSKQSLAQSDVNDLFALLKAEHGIPDPDGRTPQPLTPDQIPAPTQPAEHIVLLSMKNLRHVNAIADNQCLSFGNAGLTVIYGDNGSGKSGYSRVLKRACRARDQMEHIHSNANLPLEKSVKPEADFEIEVNGVMQEVHWINGDPSPPELSSMAIFDSFCARAYLDNEDDFSFIPYGLDVFENLANVCNQLKAMIIAEQGQYSADLTVFQCLHGDTTVGRLISTLSAKTPIIQIETLATLTQEENAHRSDIEKSLKENNPGEKASQLQLCVRRIEAITAVAKSKHALVAPSEVARLRGLDESFCTAQAAAALSTKEFVEGDSFLPGTGGKAWRELFETARKYSVESHPDKTFPQLGPDSRCPLCQQPLADGASRLMQFETFVQKESEKTVQQRKLALDKVIDSFNTQGISLNVEDAFLEEIRLISPEIASGVRAFEQALQTRYESIKKTFATHLWDDLDKEITSPVDSLQSLVEKLNVEIERLKKASEESARAELQRQFDELEVRFKLSQMKDAVVEAVLRLSHHENLKKCLASVKTTSISRKASELSERVVSKELAEALNYEFKALGVGTLKVCLQSHSSIGKALHKLKLDLPQNMSPSEILSEGEQRAIAIGSFLAEVRLSGSTGGIVFDDPVSSLDHRRRERVAKRLAIESLQRQVILFTHDIYFLCVLAEEASIAGVPLVTQQLARQSEGYGVVRPELPFEGRSTKARISALKDQHQRIAKLFKIGDEMECQKQTVEAYTQLRMAWERAVEEVLFRGVVLRFSKGVSTQKLSEVTVDDNDYAQVCMGMTKCSNYAHDKAQMGGIAVPEPDELFSDIMILDDWRAQIEKRSEDTRKRRKN